MQDLSHQWGDDLALGPGGDLAVSGGSTLAGQRILRRLLTNPGDYIWQLTYGAGLGSLIGQPLSPTRVNALIRAQIFKESAVARSPEPVINVSHDSSAAAGVFYVSITYTEATSGDARVLSFSFGP